MHRGTHPKEAVMFVVTGATGRTGSVVASTLLDAKQKVRVVVRDAQKGEAWSRRGAEVAVADLTDEAALAKAFAGADGVYLLVAPNYTSDHVFADQKQEVDAMAAAIKQAGVKHVVLLSSIGAELASGNGPIQGLHYAEEKLRPLTALTALRAAYFQENWGGTLPLARQQGILPVMLRADKRLPMVATRDIGRVAAEALLAGPSKAGVIELAGPQDYASADVAEIASSVLGKQVQRIDVPAEGMVPALTQAGLTEDLAKLFREMNLAFNEGRIKWQGEPIRGRVRLEETVRQLLG
jgi:uncharacterized protein YbjT (DUF2867 family)